MRDMFRTFKYVVIIFILIFAAGGAFFVYNSIRGNLTDEETVNVTIDDTVILNEIQELSDLKVINMIFQRDIEVELDLGNLEIAGITIAENRRTTEVAVTGSVSASVPLSEISADDIVLDSDASRIEIAVPAPQLDTIVIDEDKTRTLSDDLTLLFQLENLNNNRRIELNETLNDQVIKQSETALQDAACQAEILDMAQENAEAEIQRLFLFSGIESIEVTVQTPEGCGV
jgi:hypothetical protein